MMVIITSQYSSKVLLGDKDKKLLRDLINDHKAIRNESKEWKI